MADSTITPVVSARSSIVQSKSTVVIPAHWRPASLKEILNRDYVEPRWIIEGLLLEKSGTQVSGHPHATKSLNWLAAALESVTTHKVWGHFGASGVRRVLYIETEDPLVVVEERVRQLSKVLSINPKDVKDGFFLSRTGPFELAKMEQELKSLIKAYKPDWMVVSTLQGLLGDRDWKEQKDMAAVNSVLVRLQEICPLVLITHSTWDTKNKRAAGTITQAANFLTTMHFEKKIKDGVTTTTVSLDSKMGFEEPEFDLVLETATVPGKNRPELRRVKYAGQHKASDSELIKEYVKEHPNASPTEVANSVGCSYEYARKVMKKPVSELPTGYRDPDDPFDLRPDRPEKTQLSKKTVVSAQPKKGVKGTQLDQKVVV